MPRCPEELWKPIADAELETRRWKALVGEARSFVDREAPGRNRSVTTERRPGTTIAG